MIYRDLLEDNQGAMELAKRIPSITTELSTFDIARSLQRNITKKTSVRYFSVKSLRSVKIRNYYYTLSYYIILILQQTYQVGGMLGMLSYAERYE